MSTLLVLFTNVYYEARFTECKTIMNHVIWYLRQLFSGMSRFAVRLKSTDVSEGSAASIIIITIFIIIINQCTLSTPLYAMLFCVLRCLLMMTEEAGLAETMMQAKATSRAAWNNNCSSNDRCENLKYHLMWYYLKIITYQKRFGRGGVRGDTVAKGSQAPPVPRSN